jgi:RNA polymerase sigma factor (TIGR02999 family)
MMLRVGEARRSENRTPLESVPATASATATATAAAATAAAAAVPMTDRAFAEVYDELRRIAKAKLANERAGHTLQTTALVHEVFLKLRGSKAIESRAHFLHLAAEAMRQVLVDYARAKNSKKRGGGTVRREELATVAVLAVEPDVETIMALEEAISRLETVSPRAAEVIKLRFFAGLGVAETAEASGLSQSTVNRHWRFGRAWLFNAMGAS